MPGLLACLMVSSFALTRRGEDSSLESLLLAGEPTRRLEARLPHPLADQHRPYRASPSPPPRASLKSLARLESQGETRALVATHLLRAELAQARALLTRAPAEPDRDTQLAVVALQEHAFDEALALLDHALAAAPRHPQALWNRGLVLREMGLTLLAAESFEQVASLGEPGWSEEASAEAQRLREGTRERERAWTAISTASWEEEKRPREEVLRTAATPLPGLVRATLYQGVRTATSREQVWALLPVARELDRLQGGAFLERYLVRVAGRDFRRRAPLARGYALLIQELHPHPAAFLEQARRSGEADIYLGALLQLQAVPEHLDDFRAMVRASDDPWLQLIGERELAWTEFLAGRHEQAEQRLLHALATCDGQRFAYLCLDLEQHLTRLYISLFRLAEAQAHASVSVALARREGEWAFEQGFLNMLSNIARLQDDLPLARVYLLETAAREPKLCAFAQQSLADVSMLDFHEGEARKHMALAFQCGQPLSTLGAYLLAELARFGGTALEQEQFHRVLAELRGEPLRPGEQALLLFIEGQFEIEQDRRKGQRLLHRAIQVAERQPASDVEASQARAYAYSALVIDAGRAGEAEQVLALISAERRMPVPARCAVVVEDNHSRLVTVVRGADGRALSHFDRARTRLLGDGEGSIPREHLATLLGCPQVRVLASPSVLGAEELLPVDMAWSYQFGPPVHRGHQSGRVLVIHNVEPPPALRLDRLPARMLPTQPALDEQLIELSGSRATPSRVLKEMGQATEIEIHAHGLDRPELFDAPFIALTADEQGRYALHVSELKKHHLSQAPIVYLAACGTAGTGPMSHEPFSLPAAFIEAGASAVLATGVSIPDSAGSFFEDVRRRIRSGTPPAVALRDERAEWLAASPQEQWVKSVFLFE